MSILSDTSQKIVTIKENISSLHKLNVETIIIEDGFDVVFDTVDTNKLLDISLTKSDMIPIGGSVKNYDDDVYRRFAKYVCAYHIDNQENYKLQYKISFAKTKNQYLLY